MVAVERRDQAKSGKDLQQASTLIEVLAEKRPLELASAWQKAWQAGPRWREKLEAGLARLPINAQGAIANVIERASKSHKKRKAS